MTEKMSERDSKRRKEIYRILSGIQMRAADLRDKRTSEIFKNRAGDLMIKCQYDKKLPRGFIKKMNQLKKEFDTVIKEEVQKFSIKICKSRKRRTFYGF